MPWRGPQIEGEVPTLGFEVVRWIEEYCVIPDGDYQGEPFLLSPEQRDFILDLYSVHPDALERVDADRRGRPNRAFIYQRGGMFAAPQKWGKGPFAAAIGCAEAAGPVRFSGWSASGEPVGRPWATPLIAVTAATEDQARNVWDALLWMMRLGPLEAMLIEDSGDKEALGLSRINLRDGGRIDKVTASPKSRQGARITFAVQDEVQSWFQTDGGLKLADTQYRSLAGMGGRFTQWCNAWDPAEDSVGQLTWEHGAGVCKRLIEAGPGSIRDKQQRMECLRKVYADAPWVDLEAISTAIDDFISRGEVAQAERYFFNRIVPAEDRAVDPEAWKRNAHPEQPLPSGECTAHPKDKFHERGCGRPAITLGVDGARYRDALAVVATDVATGFQWPIGIWERPINASDDYEHPLPEVDEAVTDAFERYNVWRLYADPGHATANIEALVEKWQGRYGDKRVIAWLMSRIRASALMVQRYAAAILSGDQTHNGDAVLTRHVNNTRRRTITMKDEEGRPLWTIAKDGPMSPHSIDGFAAGSLSWEARGDSIAAGVLEAKGSAYDGRVCRCPNGPRGSGPHLRRAGCQQAA